MEVDGVVSSIRVVKTKALNQRMNRPGMTRSEADQRRILMPLHIAQMYGTFSTTNGSFIACASDSA